MSYEIYPTTAENIIGATDATLQGSAGVTENLVADFLDIPVSSARNALMMACQLELVAEEEPGTFVPHNPYAAYLVTSSLICRAAILRMVLEQYKPYRTFKHRLMVASSAREAATQTRAIHQISAHAEDVLTTFVSLGTYANSLTSEGGGLYQVAQDGTEAYLPITAEAVAAREVAEAQVRHRVGPEASTWVDEEEVLAPLVTAWQRAAYVDRDCRAPVVHAGNAVESFLVQVARHYGLDISKTSGINAKADKLHSAKKLTKKHLNMLRYLGHVRNAADHGTDVDPDVGRTWSISPNTAIEYVHVAMSVVAAVVAHVDGRFLV